MALWARHRIDGRFVSMWAYSDGAGWVSTDAARPDCAQFLRCIHCGAVVGPNQGNKAIPRRPHFVCRDEACPTRNDSWRPGMTVEHLIVQQQLRDALAERYGWDAVHLEQHRKGVEGRDGRGDVVVQLAGGDACLEVQRSVMAAADVEAREVERRDQGCSTDWVFLDRKLSAGKLLATPPEHVQQALKARGYVYAATGSDPERLQLLTIVHRDLAYELGREFPPKDGQALVLKTLTPASDLRATPAGVIAPWLERELRRAFPSRRQFMAAKQDPRPARNTQHEDAFPAMWAQQCKRERERWDRDAYAIAAAKTTADRASAAVGVLERELAELSPPAWWKLRKRAAHKAALDKKVAEISSANDDAQGARRRANQLADGFSPQPPQPSKAEKQAGLEAARRRDDAAYELELAVWEAEGTPKYVAQVLGNIDRWEAACPQLERAVG